MRLLTLLRVNGPETEAEPVKVEHVGETVALTLDDGEVLVIDWAELEDAVRE